MFPWMSAYCLNIDMLHQAIEMMSVHCLDIDMLYKAIEMISVYCLDINMLYKAYWNVCFIGNYHAFSYATFSDNPFLFPPPSWLEWFAKNLQTFLQYRYLHVSELNILASNISPKMLFLCTLSRSGGKTHMCPMSILFALKSLFVTYITSLLLANSYTPMLEQLFEDQSHLYCTAR